ncbi:MAG: cobalamin-dependent protein [Candidatus Bathyarchaeota archaeon]|nr:MAG: cobalamin-dependent protein [Candidatus Bathyarchaeota archaeon]
MSHRIFEELERAVIIGDVKKAKRCAEGILNQKSSIDRAIGVLMKAMRVVDQLYERKEYFVIDVASSASAMREAFKIFEPYIKVEPAMVKGKIIIGSLKGNIQGLGKDIVAATLQSAGFQVVNLGVDVNPEEFVKAAFREEAQIIAISISMEETIQYLKDVVEMLKRENLEKRIKVIIGGNAVSEKVRKRYGLDAYAKDANEALTKVKALLS